MGILEILGKVGFDWKVALANLVNFLIIFYLLRTLIFKTLGNAIKERNKKISDGIKNAEIALSQKDEAEAAKNQIIADAHKESAQMVKTMQSEIEERRLVLLAKAGEEVENLITQGKKVLEVEKEKMIAEAKNELAGIIVSATEKVLDGTKVQIENSLVEKAISNLGK